MLLISFFCFVMMGGGKFESIPAVPDAERSVGVRVDPISRMKLFAFHVAFIRRKLEESTEDVVCVDVYPHTLYAELPKLFPGSVLVPCANQLRVPHYVWRTKACESTARPHNKVVLPLWFPPTGYVRVNGKHTFACELGEVDSANFPANLLSLLDIAAGDSVQIVPCSPPPTAKKVAFATDDLDKVPDLSVVLRELRGTTVVFDQRVVVDRVSLIVRSGSTESYVCEVIDDETELGLWKDNPPK